MTTVQHRLTGVAVLVAAAALPAGPALAQEATRNVATGARLELTSTPSASVALDGRPLGMTPKEGVEVTPGEHRIAFMARGRSEGRTITVTAGETRLLDVNFDAPPTMAAGPAPETPPSAPVASGDVLDFCALTPGKGTGRLEKERVVLFAPSGTAQVNNDARLRAVDGARLVREVFSARFAMDRFHNVLGSLPGKRGWEAQESLAIADVRAFVRETRGGGDAASTARTEQEKQFIAYSLGCADYVVIPSVTSHRARWEDPNRITKHHEKSANALSLELEGTLAIFRRQGDWFKRIALLSASAQSFVDEPSELAIVAPHGPAGSAPGDPAVAAPSPSLPRHLSAVPDATCLDGKVATEGVPGLVACGAKGEGTIEQTRAGLDDTLGSECAGSRAGSKAENERSLLSSQCEVRTRSSQLARAFQQQARSVEGWKVFGVLAHADSPPSTWLGRADGLRIGDAFEVLGARNERRAYLKVVRTGRGGALGSGDHSLFSARSGEAPAGARIDKVPQLGLVIAPHVSFALLTYSYGTTRVHSGSTFQDFTLPDAVFGGGLTLGYDLSALLHWTESYARIGAGVFVGSGLNTSAQLVPFDLWFEKGLYLAPRLTLLAALGATVQLSSVNVLTALETVAEDLHVSSTMFGPAARLGLDVMLHPDWSLKLDVTARVPLNSASYTESDGKPIPDEWQWRDDHFATIATSVGIARTF